MQEKASDNLIFEELLEIHKPLILKVCFMFQQDSDSRKDLFQDICINVWRGLSGFKDNSLISTWIYRVALNTALSKTSRSKSNPLSMAEEYQDIYADSEDLELHSRSDLYFLINSLKPADKAIILLYLEDKSYDEIAEIIGISKKNVSVKLVRIKRKLEQVAKKLMIKESHHD